MKTILPPILFIIFAILMACICWAQGSPHTIGYPLNLIGSVLLVLGLGISSYHSRLFNKLGANIMTFDEPTKLVKRGLFKYSRNPMYLGFVLSLLGVALLYQLALSSIVIVFLFWVITDRWYIKYEEAEMLKVFGDEYLEYCKCTPRWLGIA